MSKSIVCGNCKTVFPSKKGNWKFCSPECRKANAKNYMRKYMRDYRKM